MCIKIGIQSATYIEHDYSNWTEGHVKVQSSVAYEYYMFVSTFITCHRGFPGNKKLSRSEKAAYR